MKKALATLVLLMLLATSALATQGDPRTGDSNAPEQSNDPYGHMTIESLWDLMLGTGHHPVFPVALWTVLISNASVYAHQNGRP